MSLQEKIRDLISDDPSKRLKPKGLGTWTCTCHFPQTLDGIKVDTSLPDKTESIDWDAMIQRAMRKK